MVFQNTPGKGEHIAPFQEFAQGKKVVVEKKPAAMRGAIMQRVQDSLKEPRKYSIIWNNCEQSATRVTYGKGASLQLAVGMLAVGLITYKLFKK